MKYTLPSNRPEVRVNFSDSVQRDRRIAFRLMNDLLRQIEKLPEDARTGALDDAYNTLEKIYQCRTR